MLENLRETWYMTKVETVIDARLTALPSLLQPGIAGLAHQITFNQYEIEPFVFSVIDLKRLDPRIAALHCILTFITSRYTNDQVIANNQDCYGVLKIICLGLIKEMETFPITPTDLGFVEMFSSQMIKQHFPELFT